MMRNRFVLKSISVFLVLETVFNVVSPTISWALTAGPTAPEATSFEPVDTTDMVDLTSGDLAYNLPLLNVPGPAGGYPLSLSYHAGLMPNEEASWVGLGWTLNPGAINRSVSGYADDLGNTAHSNHFYWEGGETHVGSIGIGLSLGGAASVTAGLEVGYDTYRGCGVGMSMGANVGYGMVGAGASVGVDPWGNMSGDVNVGVSVGEKGSGSISAGIGVSTNFEKVDVRGRLSAGISISGVNASMSADTKGNTNIGVSWGQSSGQAMPIRNTRMEKQSTSSWGISIPVYYFTLGYNYQRYWIDETERIHTNGALHFPEERPSETDWYDDHSYDVYSLGNSASFINSLEPERVSGGTLPAFDSYMVSAQGIGGFMRPYYFQKYLVDDNMRHYDGASGAYQNDVIQYHLGYNNKPAHFRFLNDFSNQYQYAEGSLTSGTGDPQTAMSYNFTAPVTGENSNDGLPNNRLIGSRQIEYYTNEDIRSNTGPFEKFIETRSTGFSRANLPAGQIGAFTVQNETGVKYHFSLPAYASQEYQYSENVNMQNGQTYNEIHKDGQYAYTWFLTAITGPDYVDRGQPGIDGEDWGYWVEFEYGKWTNSYTWRNPGKGMRSDVDYNFRNLSQGVKEIYYLDAIRTKTHTALFIKDMRADAKGASYTLRSVKNDNGNITYTRNGQTLTGGFTPVTASSSCEDIVTVDGEEDPLNRRVTGTVPYVARPTSSLKLKKIYLLSNQELKTIAVSKTNGIELGQDYSYSWDVQGLPTGFLGVCDFNTLTLNPHMYQNVLDVFDLTQNQAQLEEKSIRVIDLETTNTNLCPETENSFDFSLVDVPNPSTDDADYPRLGKLSLESVYFKGKGGADLLPPLRFSYELDNPKGGNGSISKASESGENQYVLTQTNSTLVTGDIIKWNNGSRRIYAVVRSISGSAHELLILGKNKPNEGSVSAWTQTKNPPYNDQAFDHWGMYKPDYQFSANEGLSRNPSSISGANADTWSLRKVVSSLGAEINISYAPDAYSNAVLYRNGSFIVQSLSDPFVAQGMVTVNFFDAGSSDAFKPGDYIDISLLYNQITSGVVAPGIYHKTSLVVSGGSTGVTIKDPVLVDFFYNYRSSPEDPIRRHVFGGNIFLRNGANRLGGGVRVTDLSVHDLMTGTTRKTTYDYQRPDAPAVISGVTSYEPVGIHRYSNHGLSPTSELLKSYKMFILGKFSDLLINAREAPAPGVMYEYVTVRESVTRGNETVTVPGYITYQFSVFNEGMVGAQRSGTSESGLGSISYDDKSINNNSVSTTKISISDFTSFIGALKRKTVFDGQGNKITEQTNHYLHDDLLDNDGGNQYRTRYPGRVNAQFKGQGIIHETYATARFAKDERANFPGYRRLLGVMTKLQKYPLIQTSQTTTNYKTGATATSENLAFDFYSGQVTKVLSSDGFNNFYIHQITPAYRVPVYEAGMQPAALGGSNMLTQEAASYIYKVAPANISLPVSNTNYKPVGLVSATTQTWSNQVPVLEAGTQTGIWRMHARFNFVGDDDKPMTGDGLFPIGADGLPVFDAWSHADQIPAQWQRPEKITLYDVHSHAIEAHDVNNHYAAAKMTSDNLRVVANVSNAQYDEFVYSGAEDGVLPNGNIGGATGKGDGTVSSLNYHTGQYSLQIPGGKKGFTATLKTTSKRSYYKVSAWVHEQNASGVQWSYAWQPAGQSKPLDSSIPIDMTKVRKAGSWYLFSAQISVPGYPGIGAYTLHLGIKNAGTQAVYVDDFRAHPVGSEMSAYVYNTWGELSHVLDDNNLYTEYRYDGIGRLNEIYKETFAAESPSAITYGIGGIVKVSEITYNFGLKAPFAIAITALKSGRGQINPAGVFNVKQGGTQSFSIAEICSSPMLQMVLIDDQQVDLNQASITLVDGTVVEIKGQLLIFKNIQSSHRLEARFLPASTLTGGVQCHKIGNCYTGTYDYYTSLDACGNPVWIYNVVFASIPAGVRPATKPNCCAMNTPSNNCACNNPEQ